jgi:hypothetical protein
MPRATWPEITRFRGDLGRCNCSQFDHLKPSNSPKEIVPYSSAAMRQDLQRVRTAWDDCQANSGRKHQTTCTFPALLGGHR